MCDITGLASFSNEWDFEERPYIGTEPIIEHMGPPSTEVSRGIVHHSERLPTLGSISGHGSGGGLQHGSGGGLQHGSGGGL